MHHATQKRTDILVLCYGFALLGFCLYDLAQNGAFDQHPVASSMKAAFCVTLAFMALRSVKAIVTAHTHTPSNPTATHGATWRSIMDITANDKGITTFLICGQAGCGKTSMLKAIVEESAGRIAFLTPGSHPDWTADAYAVDEDWPLQDLLDLEAEAFPRAKIIIAALQEPDGFMAHCTHIPAVLTIEGACERAEFIYQGQPVLPDFS